MNGLVVELVELEVPVRDDDDDEVDVTVVGGTIVLVGCVLPSTVLGDALTGSSSSLAAANAIAAISTATKTLASAILFRIRLMSARHCCNTAWVGTGDFFGCRA